MEEFISTQRVKFHASISFSRFHTRVFDFSWRRTWRRTYKKRRSYVNIYFSHSLKNPPEFQTPPKGKSSGLRMWRSSHHKLFVHQSRTSQRRFMWIGRKNMASPKKFMGLPKNFIVWGIVVIKVGVERFSQFNSFLHEYLC